MFYTGLTSFFTDTSTKMVYSVMPMFLMSIGASKTKIALIEGIAESTASLLKALSGLWSDKIGKNKPFMIFGYVLTALITPVYALAGKPVHILWLRFIERIGKGVRTAPRDSLISSSVGKEKTGRNFGFHKAMDNSGAILGPLAAFAILYFLPGSYSTVFVLSAIPALIGVIIIIFMIAEAHNGSGERRKVSLKELPAKFWFYLFIIFIFSLGNSTDALLLVKTADTGINKAYVPFIYMIFNTVSVIFAIPIGKLSDKKGRTVMIVTGYLIYSAVYFLFGRFNDAGIFIALFVLYGLYSAFADGSQKSLVSDITSKDMKGTAFGLYHAVLGISLLPASIIAGYLYDSRGSGAPFYFGSVMSLSAAVLMVIYRFKYRVKDDFKNNHSA